MKRRLLQRQLMLWLAVIISLPAAIAQQSSNVSGVVRNEKGDPLTGATIVVKNAKTSFTANAISDSLGVFSFKNLPAGGPYSFSVSAVGYEQQSLGGYQLKPDASVLLTLKLNSQAGNLTEVVVVGYGTQKKENLTSAVAQVKGEAFDNRAVPNVSQGLQGLIPNLNLVMGDGKPVQSPVFNIRGTTSIGQGGNALVLIDGVQGDPALLNPNDIASVSVLKDASSASIYGARAAFGVVLITTKTPVKDRISVNYSANYASKRPTVVPDIVSNGYEYAKSFSDAWSGWNDYSQTAQNINKTQTFSAAYLEEYKRRNADPSLPKVEVGANGNYVYYGNTNWFDLLYKKRLGAIDQSLSVSGNNGKASFYITGRYNKQDGLFRFNSDNYHMYNLTAKGNIQVTPWLQVYNTTQYNNRFYHNPLNVGEGGSIWANMGAEAHPSSMLYNPDGTLTFSAAYTVGDFVYGRNGIDMTDQVIRNTSGFVAKVLKNNLRLKGDVTFQNTSTNQNQVRVPVPYSVTPGVIAYVGTAYNDITVARKQTNYLASNIYGEYENTFGRVHYFKALLGYNYEQSTYNNYQTTRNGLIYNPISDLNLALGQSISTAGGYDKWAILGGFFRFNYAFNDRYLLEVNGRYDGSSKFPSNQRYGFFPSASAGWRVSKEAFWHVNPKAISDVKIRGSYGSLGNGSIDSYTYQDKFAITQSGRVLNGVLPQTTSSPVVLPDGLTWETATTADLGLDAAFLSNRLTFTGDLYERKTKNMFTVGKTLPAVFGATQPKGNYADLTTKGWEVSIAWKDEFKIADKPFHYNVSVWMSDYTATVDKYNNITGSLASGNYYAGQKMGEIWGYVNDGFFTDKDDLAQAKKSQTLFKPSNGGNWMAGDLKFKDLDGNGVINNGDNTIYKPGDRQVVGNATPRYTYGANISGEYNNFFFGLFFQGVGKQDWWPGAEAAIFWGQYNRPYQYLFQSQVGNIWSAANPNAYFPRLRGYVAQNGSGELVNAQSKYIQNVRYLRLKNAQIGYNLPKGFIAKAHLNAARVYVSGENLFAVSPLYKHTKAMDVEGIGASDAILTGTSNSGNGNNYPILKSVSVGLSVTF